MAEQSRDYYERRANEERLAAENARDERAAESHRELASRYQRAAAGDDVPHVENQVRLDSGTAQGDFRIVP